MSSHPLYPLSYICTFPCLYMKFHFLVSFISTAASIWTRLRCHRYLHVHETLTCTYTRTFKLDFLPGNNSSLSLLSLSLTYPKNAHTHSFAPHTNTHEHEAHEHPIPHNTTDLRARLFVVSFKCVAKGADRDSYNRYTTQVDKAVTTVLRHDSQSFSELSS